MANPEGSVPEAATQLKTPADKSGTPELVIEEKIPGWRRPLGWLGAVGELLRARAWLLALVPGRIGKNARLLLDQAKKQISEYRLGRRPVTEEEWKAMPPDQQDKLYREAEERAGVTRQKPAEPPKTPAQQLESYANGGGQPAATAA